MLNSSRLKYFMYGSLILLMLIRLSSITVRQNRGYTSTNTTKRASNRRDRRDVMSLRRVGMAV